MPKNKREFGHLTRTTRAGIEALAIEIKLGRKKKRMDAGGACYSDWLFTTDNYRH